MRDKHLVMSSDHHRYGRNAFLLHLQLFSARLAEQNIEEL